MTRRENPGETPNASPIKEATRLLEQLPPDVVAELAARVHLAARIYAIALEAEREAAIKKKRQGTEQRKR